MIKTKAWVKVIIWLFEKYAYDYWVDYQMEEGRKEFKQKHKLEDDEIEQAMIDIQEEPQKEAYEAGKADGYEQAMDEKGC